MPDDLGLLFHRAGGDICYDSLILRRPGYFDAAFYAWQCRLGLQ